MECNVTYICPDQIVPIQKTRSILVEKIKCLLTSFTVEGAEDISKIK